MLVYASMSRHQKTVQKSGTAEASPLLITLCRWCIRLLVAIAALPLITIGLLTILTNFPAGLCLVFAGLCVLGSEGFISWLNKLEKK